MGGWLHARAGTAWGSAFRIRGPAVQCGLKKLTDALRNKAILISLSWLGGGLISAWAVFFSVDGSVC